MKKTLCLLVIVIISTAIFPIINEEQARELFSQALSLWYEGDVIKARSLMDEALSGLIYVSDIPEFWFFTSKIDIDMRAVEKAQEDLKTILVISPGKSEVLSVLKEIETLQKPLEFSTPTVFNELITFSGFQKGTEYFYTPNAVAFLGDSLVIADRANKRLILTREGNYQIFKTNITPNSLSISPSGQLYIAGDGKLFEYDLENQSEKIIYEGMVNPILAGFDRIGRLWGADVDRVFVYDGKSVSFSYLDDFSIINDIELTPYGFWILDVMKNQLNYFDFSFKKIKSYSSYNAWSFEVSIHSDPIIITKDEKLAVILEDGPHEFCQLPSGTVAFEYLYPYLILMNWKQNTVSIQPMKSQEPVLVKIDSLAFENDNINLSVRVENVFGETIPYVKDFLEVREGGGPVFFNAVVTHEKLQWLKADQGFFEKTLPFIKRGAAYGILFQDLPDNWRRTDIVTLRGKNAKIFTSSSANDFVILSGGAGLVSSPVDLWQIVWKITFARRKPLPSEITPVTVQMRFGDELYSDTIYYTRGLIK